MFKTTRQYGEVFNIRTPLPQEFHIAWIDKLVSRVRSLLSFSVKWVEAISVEEQCLVLHLAWEKQERIHFEEMAEVLFEPGRLLKTVILRGADGVCFRVASFNPNRIMEAYEVVVGQQQIYNIRKNWNGLDRFYGAFMKFMEAPGFISNSELKNFLNENPMPKLLEDSQAIEAFLSEWEHKVLATIFDLRKAVNERNDKHVEQNIEQWDGLFKKVENNPLTYQQKLAVLHDEDNTLVLAGAGTGKTSTIVAKVGYLLKSRLAEPGDILLLSFTRKSADEMRERISIRLGADVEVHTFHSLGLKIIGSVEQKKPSISKDAEDDKKLKATLGALLESLFLSDSKLRSSYKQFVTSNLVPYRSRFEFRTEGEYMTYLKELGMRALSGEVLKSYEEIEIANWLYLNGVQYLYEPAYEFDTASVNYRQYRPDFYYPDYNIYHEHFGIRRDGSTASFVDRDKYHAGMIWKRDLHKRHETLLIETYSWMKEEGTLLLNLEDKLKEHDVKMAPLPPVEVLARFREASFVNPLIDLLSAFLKLFKGSCLTEEEIKERAKKNGSYLRNQLFLNIFLPLYYAYEEKHRKSREIDFDDMIQEALKYVSSFRYQSRYRYIIIDEFQDISHGRAMLVKAMREQVEGCRLFCVGDDWQAIYRFAGSDISLITAFPDFFGYTKTIALDSTFRFNNRIVDFSSEFILKNKSQLSKKLSPNTVMDQAAIELVEVGTKADPYVNILESIMGESTTATVYFLGRYNSTVPDQKRLNEFRGLFSSLQIEAMTIHKSKGLEADYVIICDLKAGRNGFPCEITDDPILNLVLGNPDKFPHGEERRLFYVAVTRARKKVYLVVPRNNPSVFAREILDNPKYLVNRFTGYPSYDEIYCPACKSGYLVTRRGERGSFAGCSNYPLCEYKQDMCKRCGKGVYASDLKRPHISFCSVCGDENEICPKCRVGFLQRRNGPHGPFMGCTLYGSRNCRFTRKIKDDVII